LKIETKYKHNVINLCKLIAFLDYRLFVGARSDVGQSDWFWNNETRITDPNYHASNSSDCQQMTWPLTYDDGINLSPKLCSKEYFHLCQIMCKIFWMLELFA